MTLAYDLPQDLPLVVNNQEDWIRTLPGYAAEPRLLQRASRQDARKALAERISFIVFKHMAGRHNQKRHGWRYGGGEARGTYESRLGAARRSLRRTPEAAERTEYRRRAGMPTPTRLVKPEYTKPTPAPAAPKPAPAVPKPKKPPTYVEMDPNSATASHASFHSSAKWRAWVGGLTFAERSAIRSYIGRPGEHGTYQELNRSLREGTFDPTSHPHSTLTKTYQGMDTAIDKGRLHKDMVLWRSMDYEPLHSGAGTRFKAGDVIPDRAFVSTAPKKGTATGWFFFRGYAPVLWRIKAPKGSKGAYLSWDELSNPYMHETEFVLPRNSRFKIDAVDYQTISGKRTAVYDMTLLPD